MTKWCMADELQRRNWHTWISSFWVPLLPLLPPVFLMFFPLLNSKRPGWFSQKKKKKCLYLNMWITRLIYNNICLHLFTLQIILSAYFVPDIIHRALWITELTRDPWFLHSWIWHSSASGMDWMIGSSTSLLLFPLLSPFPHLWKEILVEIVTLRALTP